MYKITEGITKLSMVTPLPPHLRCKGVCEKALSNRVFSIAEGRLDKIIEGFQVDGSFTGTPIYTLTFDGDRVRSIIHASGDRVGMPEHVVITKNFAMADTFSDANCSLELPPTKYTIRDDLFKSSPGGPFKNARVGKKATEKLVEMSLVDLSADYTTGTSYATLSSVALDEQSFFTAVALKRKAEISVKAQKVIAEERAASKRRSHVTLG